MLSPFLRMVAHIIGVVVSETTREMRMATERVTANSRNNPAHHSPHQKNGSEYGDQGNAH